MKALAYYVSCIIVLTSCKQTTSSSIGELQWLTVEEAISLAEDGTDKKFLVDVYTDWCGWCKVMDQKTFTDPQLKMYLQENFHLVKFNAEQKEPITFKGKTYEWQDLGRNGVHNLAVELLQGQMGYPTLVYLDPGLSVIRVSQGYKDAVQLQGELSAL